MHPQQSYGTVPGSFRLGAGLRQCSEPCIWRAAAPVALGGYGHVGQKIARRLVAAGRPVTLAGRDGAKAGTVAARLGCEGTILDLERPETWTEPLSTASVVICCIDTRSADLARAALERGACLIDISATDTVLRRIEQLDGLATDTGALAVLRSAWRRG